ncbi:MAG: ClbS/DfsB family four-helix bundle protein [Promethearchaeota archaeon]
MKSIQIKEKLIELIKAERKNLELMINDLSKDQMLSPNVQGEWSIKDIIVHLTTWEQHGMGWIKAISKGDNPDVPLKGYSWKDFELLNEEIYQKNRNRPLEEIISESTETFNNLIKLLQEFPKEYLEKTFYSKEARKEHFLGKDVIYWRSLHYKTHNQHIKKWLEKK